MTDAFDQLEMFGRAATDAYPDQAGHRGVTTSVEAAQAIQPLVGRLQRLALDAISTAGRRRCTANELAHATGLPREAIQPRTSELRKQGRIVDSGRRRENANGKRAIVWTLPQYRGAMDG